MQKPEKSAKAIFYGTTEAIAVLVGTIIGAGVFTLPYVASRSGLVTVIIWLAIVCLIIIFLHLAFGEIVQRTAKDFRLPGYAGYYLGAPAKKLMLIITFFTFSFSLLIYLLLGGQFLKTLFLSFNWGNILPLDFLVVFLWLVLNVIILSKRHLTTKVNFYLSLALLFLFFFIACYALPHFKMNNLNLFQFSNKWGWLLPYGVIFFALNGMVAVPEAAKVLNRKNITKDNLKKVIIIGTLIPAFCYFLFIMAVVGVSGPNTTIEAVRGLMGILGREIVAIGAVLGFLAVTTSYLIFATYIKNSFRNDFGWSPFVGNFLVVAGPLILYFANFASLIKLISFLGGMLGGLEGAMILLILKKAKIKSDLKPAYEIPFNKLILMILFFALISGALCQTFLAH